MTEKAVKPKTQEPKQELDIQALMNRLQELEQEVAEAKASRPLYQKAKTEEDKFKETYGKTRIIDQLYPDMEWPFREGDVVRLKKGSPKWKLIHKFMTKLVERAPENEEAATILKAMDDGLGPLGTIQHPMYRSKKQRGQNPKFKVAFPGIGRDGVLASELEAV